MFIFGMQMMVQAQYNVFGDQMMPFIFGMARSPRFEVLWCLHAIFMNRLRAIVDGVVARRRCDAGHQQLPDY
jgi:hypothetical protein